MYTNKRLNVRGKTWQRYTESLSHLQGLYRLGPGGCDQKSRILEQCDESCDWVCSSLFGLGLWETGLSHGAEEILPNGPDMSELCGLEHVVCLLCFSCITTITRDSKWWHKPRWDSRLSGHQHATSGGSQSKFATGSSVQHQLNTEGGRRKSLRQYGVPKHDNRPQ